MTQTFKLRLAQELKARLEESARKSSNSLNSEICRRLGQSYHMDQLNQRLTEVQRELAEAHQRYFKLADYTLALTAPKVPRPKAKAEDAA